jgi:hypothetical protein
MLGMYTVNQKSLLSISTVTAINPHVLFCMIKEKQIHYSLEGSETYGYEHSKYLQNLCDKQSVKIPNTATAS